MALFLFDDQLSHLQPPDLESFDVEALYPTPLTVKVRIAKAPIAREPIAVAPTATAPMPVAPIAARPNATCVPEEDRSTCASLRIFIAFSPVPALR